VVTRMRRIEDVRPLREGADLLVGADGVHSLVRRSGWSDRAHARSHGMTVLRGTTPLDPPELSETWGRGWLFGITPLAEVGTNWFACVPEHRTGPRDQDLAPLRRVGRPAGADRCGPRGRHRAAHPRARHPHRTRSVAGPPEHGAAGRCGACDGAEPRARREHGAPGCAGAGARGAGGAGAGCRPVPGTAPLRRAPRTARPGMAAGLGGDAPSGDDDVGFAVARPRPRREHRTARPALRMSRGRAALSGACARAW